jgi:hypothetical protein
VVPGEEAGVEGAAGATFEVLTVAPSVRVVLEGSLLVLETPFASPARRTPDVRCGGADTFACPSDPTGTTTMTGGAGSGT